MSSAITVAGIGAAGALGSAYISSKGKGGGGGNSDFGELSGDYNDIMGMLPSYWEDPLYDESQGRLNDLSAGFLEGDVPDFYKSLVETGSPEFENYLDLVQRDTASGVEESAAARGVGRSGPVDTAVARAVGDITARSRYDDFLRTQGGKEKFLGYGITGQKDVRNSAHANEAQRNTFYTNRANMALGVVTGQQARTDRLSAGEQDYYSSLVGGGMELAGTVAGMFAGNKNNNTNNTNLSPGTTRGSVAPQTSQSWDALVDSWGQRSYDFG